MVTTPVDPIRVPTITLSPDELTELRELIAAGQLPKDFLDRHFDAVDANVFGHDAPKDKNGMRLEQGLGSAAHPTRNSVEAYKKFGRDEPDFERHLAKMERSLAEYEAKRPARAR